MSANVTPVNGEEALVHAEQSDTEKEFWRFVGALGFSQKLTDSLSAQNLHALDHIKRERLYLKGGYQTFDDFLDHDPHSPMKSEAFRRRWNLLQGEGDDTFNLLSSLKVPLETRKLLAGEVRVANNEITIGGIATSLDDNDRIVELISVLHKKSVELHRTNERGKKDNEKWKRKALEAEKRAISINPDGTETGLALLTAAGALARLRESLAEASDEEKEALREPIFELLRNNQLECSIALGVISKSDVRKPADDLGVTDDEAEDLLGG